MKNLRVDNFLQLFVQALQNKLLALPKKDNKKLPYVENYLTEFVSSCLLKTKKTFIKTIILSDCC